MANGTTPPRWQPAVLAALVLGVWGLVLWTPLVYDDLVLVASNPLLWGPWPGLGVFLTGHFGGSEYEPLVAMLHWGLLHAGGTQPLPYRLSSLLLHAANAVLFWRLARPRLASQAPRASGRLAFAAAALFALFPAHAETLAVSTFKKHLLVAFFGLLLLNLQAARRPWKRAACWGCLALGLLCKESALVLPLLALTAGWKERRRDAALHAGLFAIAGLYVGARIFLLPRRLGAWVGGSLAIHLLTSGKILLWNLGELSWPSSLCLEHSLGPARGEQAVFILAGLASLCWLERRLRRLDRVAWLGFVWCLLALAPFANVVPYLNLSLVADRYLYLASAGFFLMCVRLLSLLPVPEERLGLGLGALALAYCALGVRHAALFADPLELWARTAACAPANPRAFGALGHELLRRRRYPEAQACLQRALELEPGYLAVRLDLAEVYAETGRLAQASALAEDAAGRTTNSRAWHQLGLYRLKAGRPREALEALERAAELDPGNGAIRIDLARCLLALGRSDQARREFARASADPRARAWAAKEARLARAREE